MIESTQNQASGEPLGNVGTSQQLLIGAKEARSRLSISDRTLWSLTNCNAIPSRRIGRRVLYVVAELEAWITLGCPTEPGSGERARKATMR